MKPETDPKSNISNHHSNGSHNNNNNNNNNIGSIFTNQRKGAVHDLTQVIIENCLKMMTESHRLMSKYHSSLILFSNGHLGESFHQIRDELKSLRVQSFNQIKQCLDKMLPQIDQISLNDNDLSKCLNQVLSYLEYLKYEFLRHLYLLNSFLSMHSNELNNGDSKNLSTLVINGDQLSNKNELNDINRDIKESDALIHLINQKYFIFDFGKFEPNLPTSEQQNKSQPNNTTTNQKVANSSQLFSKFKFICCLCSPKYV